MVNARSCKLEGLDSIVSKFSNVLSVTEFSTTVKALVPEVDVHVIKVRSRARRVN